jgi:hypothetical protein
MRAFVWIVAATLWMSSAAAAPPAPRKARSPRNECRNECRKQYRRCMKAGTNPGGCFKDRRGCYRECRKKHPPTPVTPR